MVQEKPSVDRPSGGDTPLRHFKGVLDSYGMEQREFQGRKYSIVEFNFKDLDVIDSEEPYPFPIAIIRVGYAPPSQSRGGNKWEALAASVRKLSPANPDIDILIGKPQEWKRNPFRLRQALVDEDGQPVMEDDGKGGQKQQWGDVDVPCWQVVSVDGLGSTQQADQDFDIFLVELADGKADKDFYEAALTNSQVTARPSVVTAITDRKLLDTLIQAGKLSRDEEGVLHKV